MSLLSQWLAFLFFATATAGTVSGTVSMSGANNTPAVVYFDRIPGKKFTPTGQPVSINQVNLTFNPRVTAILAGTPVGFPNGDDVAHNVFSPGPAQKFTLGSYGKGAAKYRVFTTPGEYTILCDVHTEMSAHIIVTETPYFALTDKDGNYAIPNVPPGSYVVKVWHERYKSRSEVVQVVGPETVTVNFQLKR